MSGKSDVSLADRLRRFAADYAADAAADIEDRREMCDLMLEAAAALEWRPPTSGDIYRDPRDGQMYWPNSRIDLEKLTR